MNMTCNKSGVNLEGSAALSTDARQLLQIRASTVEVSRHILSPNMTLAALVVLVVFSLREMFHFFAVGLIQGSIIPAHAEKLQDALA